MEEIEDFGNMNEIMVNPGLLHIREQIFGLLDDKTLKICCVVNTDWNAFLKRFSAVKFLLEFGKMKTLRKNVEFQILIPGWIKAVKESNANAEELREIQYSLEELLIKTQPIVYTDKPVHIMATKGHLKLMKLFLQTSYDFNQCDEDGDTPFHKACGSSSSEKVVELMILASKENNIDLNCLNKCGRTAFNVACIEGHIDNVKLLVLHSTEYGIDLNTQDKFGRSGFHIAIDYGNAEVVKFLIECERIDYDLTSTNHEGDNALHIACYDGHSDVVKLLIETALQREIDLFTLNGKSQTILHSACQKDIDNWSCETTEETVKILLEHSTDMNLDLNHQDHLGRTALHHACYHSLSEAVEVLLGAAKEKGIDATISDIDNRTILHSWSLGHERVDHDGTVSQTTLNLILESYKELGLDIQHQDNHGKTALDYIKDEIEEGSDWEELKSILEEAYSKIDDSEPEAKCSKME